MGFNYFSPRIKSVSSFYLLQIKFSQNKPIDQASRVTYFSMILKTAVKKLLRRHIRAHTPRPTFPPRHSPSFVQSKVNQKHPTHKFRGKILQDKNKVNPNSPGKAHRMRVAQPGTAASVCFLPKHSSRNLLLTTPYLREAAVTPPP